MEDDYLHKINIDQLSKELNLSLDEIAALAGIKHSKNLGKWAQSKPDGARPNYNALIKLLGAGATTKTLFGIEQKHSFAPQLPPEIANDPDFLAGQNQALKDIEAKIEARVKSEILDTLKTKGVI